MHCGPWCAPNSMRHSTTCVIHWPQACRTWRTARGSTRAPPPDDALGLHGESPDGFRSDPQARSEYRRFRDVPRERAKCAAGRLAPGTCVGGARRTCLRDRCAQRARAADRACRVPGCPGVARGSARRCRGAGQRNIAAAPVRGSRQGLVSGGRHLRAGRGLRGQHRRGRARLRRHRPVQPGDPARRGERLSGETDHRHRGARGGGPRGRNRAPALRGGLAGRIRGNRRKRCDDARRRRRAARGRARAVRLGARPEPDVPHPLVPARRGARRRARGSAQHRRAGIAAPGDGGRHARGAFGPHRGLWIPLECGTAAAGAGMGGMRAVRRAAAPLPSRDRRRHGRSGHPPHAARHGRCAGPRGRADRRGRLLRRPSDGPPRPDARSGVAVRPRAEPYPGVQTRVRPAGVARCGSRDRPRRGRPVRAHPALDHGPGLAGWPDSPCAARPDRPAHRPDPCSTRRHGGCSGYPRTRRGTAGGIPFRARRA